METKAWTVKKGSFAPQCAGVIHTDFERGFIRAETIAYDDYIKYNGEEGCKNAGKLSGPLNFYVVTNTPFDYNEVTGNLAAGV